MLINVLRDEKPTHVAVAFDVSDVDVPAPSQYAEYKAGRAETPADFMGQVCLVHEVLDALRGADRQRARASRPTTSSPRWPRRPRRQGMDVLIVTGDRDAFQLVNERRDRPHTRSGVSRHAPHDPRGGAGEVRPVARAVPGLRRAARRPQRQPARHPRRRARRPPPSGSSSTATLAELVDRRRRGQGQDRRHRCAPRLADVIRNRHADRARPRRAARGRPARPAAARRGTATRSTRSSTRCSSGSCASGSTQRCPPSSPEADQGFDVERPPARRRARWRVARRARPAGSGRVGVHVRGTWERGTGTRRRRSRWPTADGARRLRSTSTHAHADDDAALAAGSPTPTRPRRVHDAKGPMLALAAQAAGRSPGSPATPRSRPTWRCPVSGVVRPGRPRAALPAPRAARRGPPSDGQLTPRRRREAEEAEADVASAPAPSPTSRSRSTPTSSAVGGTALLRDLELPLVDVLAGMERTGIAADVDHLADLETHLARQVKEAAEAAYDTVGHEFHLGSPKQLQAAAVRRARAAEDQEDQDRLHHRRRRARRPCSRHHPLIEALLLHRDMTRLLMVVENAAADRRRRRPHPHDLQADGRGDRPAVDRPPEPAERPDPHRAGPPDPAGLRRRPGLRDAA